MVNRPKQIGTAAETAVLRKLFPYFPDAKRVVLHGSDDQGDIDSGDGMDFIFEVKGGKQCSQISDMVLAKWMAEADLERDNARKRFGVLVCQRAGVGAPNAHRWWCYVHLGDLAQITGGFYRPGKFAVARLELGDFLELIADHDLTADRATPIVDMTAEDDLLEALIATP